MAITPRLDLRQGQSLVMTPQLQQSIKLVQLNNIELSAFIDTELEKNPLLERKDGDTSEGEAPEGAGADGEPIESDSALERTADMAAGEELADIDLSSDDYWSGEARRRAVAPVIPQDRCHLCPGAALIPIPGWMELNRRLRRRRRCANIS
jgi:RNA polymerase sigma-54 factor